MDWSNVQEVLKEPYTEDGSLDIHGRPALRLKTGNWQAAAFMLVAECFETVAYFGVSTNLIMYLSKIFHGGNASVAASVSTWTGTGFFTPFLGALIADSDWGRYRTVLISFSIYLVGMVVITVSASFSPSCEGTSCPSVINIQKLVFFLGLYFVAFGSGGLKSSLLPLGADQFEDGNPIEKQRKESFFSWFYLCVDIGPLISSTVIVWIQENVNWALGFGSATLCLAVAVGAFLSGKSIYRVQRPNGSPLKRILQVLVVSMRNRSLKVPVNSCNLYEVNERGSNTIGSRKLQHTDEFRFLDKATIMSERDTEDGNSEAPWKLCTVTQVEELKILLRLLPIWACGVFYSVAFAQANTTFLEQGIVMNTKIGTFFVPPASLLAYQMLIVMLWIFIYDRVISSITKRFMDSGLGLSPLKKMGIGRFLMILVMLIAALVESKRLKSVRNGTTTSIVWQLPKYSILAVSEVFNYTAYFEFFYSQAPDSMRSMCTAFSLLSISAGHYLYALLIMLVTRLTEWIPDNLNEGHLDYFFWAMAALSTLNFLVHVACARSYKLKKIILED